MKNFLDCVRSRQQPIAPIEAGYAHSVAVIMGTRLLPRDAAWCMTPQARGSSGVIDDSTLFDSILALHFAPRTATLPGWQAPGGGSIQNSGRPK